MSGDPVLLGGVPKPFGIEAASSWLSRLALAQGCTVRELLRFLNLSSDEDLDVQLRGNALSELRRKCGLPGVSFAYAEFVIDGVQYAKLRHRCLLSDRQRSSRFRVCPDCLMREGEGGGTMFILWRFVDWRYCPLHRCLMDERCFACRSHIRFPIDMDQTRAGREGFASQRRCQNCAADLAEAPRVTVDFDSSARFSEREQGWLLAGRKFVATFCGEGSGDPAHLCPSMERLLMVVDDLPRPEAWRIAEARIRFQATREANATSKGLWSKGGTEHPAWPWPPSR